jgi:hypothetical protein
MENKICARCGMEYPNHKMSCKIPVEEWRLPTAEEFRKQYQEDLLLGRVVLDKMLIEFAKLHCEEQSKAILKKVKQEIACDAYSTEHFNLSVKPSILNAYPLDLIK